MELKSILEYLVEHGYVMNHKGLYKFTAKFNKEIKGVEMGLTAGPGGVPLVIEPAVPKQVSWTQLYMQFIMEAGVPKKINGPSGESYQANAYSEPAMKAFRKAIDVERVEYAKLVAATKLYYKSIPYPVAIGRFMEEGIWRTSYMELEKHIEAGTLNDHVKASQHGTYSKWTLGLPGD